MFREATCKELKELAGGKDGAEVENSSRRSWKMLARSRVRWHTCMDVLRSMHLTREDKALVAAVQGTIAEDSRDTLRGEVTYMAGDFESMITAIERRGTLIEKNRTGSYDQTCVESRLR